MGWNATFYTWPNKATYEILRISGGCVCYVDYTAYTNWDLTVANSIEVGRVDFYPIARVVAKKIRHVGNFERMFIFGDSFGGLLAIEVGATGGEGRIGRMHLCDPVRQFWYPKVRRRDPKTASKSVSCVRTDTIVGGEIYNCHQDWRMGYCGYWQPASIDLVSKKSHELCSVLYTYAFDNNFVPKKPTLLTRLLCRAKRVADLDSPACRGSLMGYRDASDSRGCRGEFFIETTKYPPYV